MRLLELFELQEQEGPCLDAFRTGERVGHENLGARGPAAGRRFPSLPSRPASSRRLTDVARAAIDGTLDPLAWAAV
jgi:hypothetical protein